MNNQKQQKQKNPIHVTASVQPIKNNDNSITKSITESMTDYKKAVDNWKIKTDNYWKARNHASDTGGAFICAEPPSKPKLEDFI